MADKNLISIIICETDKDLCEGLLKELPKLDIPTGKLVDVQVICSSEGNLAAAYNAGMKQSNAKYRLFIDESARNLDKELLLKTLNALEAEGTGAVGLFGSEMPIDGDFSKSRKRVGMYVQHEISNPCQGNVILGENPLWKQKVHCLDGRFIAVAEDIEWDETVGDDFAAAAMCTRYRKEGYDCVVPMQDNPWLTLGKPSFYAADRNPGFAAETKKFFEGYWDIVQPLVSILIPTYNQPKYFEKALKSALEQDYKNIEIIIGDDSTNNETKKLMERSYLKQYPQIRYFFHGKPLGGDGMKNVEFILNHADGDYISFLFHDDIYYPMKISRMMACYVEDLEEKLGVVTSSRDAIDENGNMLGRFNPWEPSGDTVITGNQMAEGIFSRMANIIGELTTVILRKRLLKQRIDDLPYHIGIYCGIADTEMADVSTFLEMCKGGRSCMFLRDTMSAFRMHSGQKTGKPGVVIGALMEWMDYLVLSWLNDIYIHEWEQLVHYFLIWHSWAMNEFNYVMRNQKGEALPESGEWCMKIFDEMNKGNYKKVVDIAVSYMMKRADDTSVLERVCRKNERGLWCRR